MAEELDSGAAMRAVGIGVQSDSVPRKTWIRRLTASLMCENAAKMAPFVLAALAAATPAQAVTVGDLVLNPLTGEEEVVARVLADSVVQTESGVAILTTQNVGDEFTDSSGVRFRVVSVTTQTIGGATRTIAVNLLNLDTLASAMQPVVFQLVPKTGPQYAFPVPGFVLFPNENFITLTGKGKNGDDGNTPGEKGKAGEDGPYIPLFDFGSSEIIAADPQRAGIHIASIGGNGGDGAGNALGADPGKGGAAGDGGAIYASILGGRRILTGFGYSELYDQFVTGDNVYGIFVQSAAGRGGDGGDGYVGSGGADGGIPANGGSVTLLTNADILTSGAGAHAILAQSLGGDGGEGGNAFLSVKDGGGGSYGGNGGAVNVTHMGSAQTAGIGARGIVVQSIGGDGGDAGASILNIVALGNSGGPGGNGGSATVTLDRNSIVSTQGAGATGVLAQSIGGGGGSGGTSLSIASFGSTGGSGGSGGFVRIYIREGAIVATRGVGSDAVVGQSIGGGGGLGNALNAGLVALGGAVGGDGGVASNVIIESSGRITTQGRDSRGIVAQSIGGGGGSAGGSAGLISLGGLGGGGGDAGSATVRQFEGGSIETWGNGSSAIFAQSVGGGGGSGGYALGVAAVGGEGGGRSRGGNVLVSNSGSISTLGNNARGIFAQSVGGGGGDGGFGVGALTSIGGRGGDGGDAGSVNVFNAGTIFTSGLSSTGILAQAVGGGGGNAGVSGSLGLTIGGIGGGGGSGGAVSVEHSGAIVTGYDSDGRLNAVGSNAAGILAQSIGGGGGNAGAAGTLGLFTAYAIGGSGGFGGAGGTVDLTMSANSRSIDLAGGVQFDLPTTPLVVTGGSSSIGVLGQSIGGGGGNGGFAVSASVGAGLTGSFAVGGSGGLGGAGGSVSLSGDVDVYTSGNNSHGILLQSIGGGGGNGGLAGSLALSAGTGIGLSLALGGSGGSGGSGGAIAADSGGIVVTRGDFATGFTAQSIGGGGGNGGLALALSGSATLVGVVTSTGIGGSGAIGGFGGQVIASHDGSIFTSGLASTGALVQSVGGGGGNGGFSISGAVSGDALLGGAGAIGFGGRGGTGASGGQVIGRVGSVFTEGDQSAGAVFQSIGGGGGNGGYTLAVSGGFAIGISATGSIGFGGMAGSALRGGDVVGETGSITTLGAQSTGVVAQSIGGGGGNGGFNVSVAASMALASASGGIGFGGSAGSGANGGNVTLNVTGAVDTSGPQSGGIVAQSVGGGGGNGGFNVVGAISSGRFGSLTGAIGHGGSGGGAARGGTVSADIREDVTTRGDQSDGIVVQSLGGGGGAGGFNVVVSAGGGGGISAGTSIGFGGEGGTGGAAGIADLKFSGDVVTFGDQSNAIVVQAIGGGGGAGGFNVSGGVQASAFGAASSTIGFGGTGGNGGTGGGVTYSHIGDVVTHGVQSSGVTLQSVGGGGGAGGFNLAVDGGSTVIGAGLSNALGFGGIGGTAAAAGDAVSGTNHGAVNTLGAQSAGIIAQSLGGGGGAGGFNLAGSLAIGGGGVNSSAAIGLGGRGGAGGDGGVVQFTQIGDVTTLGSQSAGIVAQSVGGGGGAGGFNLSGAASGGSLTAVAVSVGVGGSGGVAGDGDAVILQVSGDLTTLGDDSRGVLAQSVGGGGGEGGFNLVAGITASAGVTQAMTVGVGGSGGAAGDAGTVELTYAGRAFTMGDRSGGLVAQSIGGGGGSGGFNLAGGLGSGLAGVPTVIGLGGLGGSGGAGGDVRFNLNGLVQSGTEQDRSDDSAGVLLQSISGGGGNGGFNFGAAIAVGPAAATVTIGTGGPGGVAHDSGSVVGTAKLDIFTSGARSAGFAAQSIAGGGGNGGFNFAGGIATGGLVNGSLGIGGGGLGAGGGNGGLVEVSLSGLVITQGDSSVGALAQSIGGGGGNGGFNIVGVGSASLEAAGTIGLGVGGIGGGGGTGGSVTFNRIGTTATDGADSAAVIAQSIGGGGGNGGFTITAGASGSSNLAGNLLMGVGGLGAGGGDGGAVTLTMDHDPLTSTQILVQTRGDRSIGVLAQSVGGGGGNAGFAVSGDLSGSGTASAGIGANIGGIAGAGGDGGSVIARLGIDRLVTTGTGSAGAIAQSIGGGGGTGGFSLSASAGGSGSFSFNSGMGLGGAGATGGDGGSVSMDLSGLLDVSGNRSSGVLAQSVGGGGGAGGFAIGTALTANGSVGIAATVGLGGIGGGGGDAGEVVLTRTGDSITRGSGSDAIVAQSVGGGGGAGGFAVTGNVSGGSSGSGGLSLGLGGFGGNGGDGGDASSSITGSVRTLGEDSRGVLVQSVGGGGGAGGFALGSVLAASGTGSGSLTLGIGGLGGDGGNSGLARLNLTGPVGTAGRLSDAVIVQSIGGGGGAGGFAVNSVLAGAGTGAGAVSLGIGGFGGFGGDAGDAIAQIAGDIVTASRHSRGVIVQSVGGGGGAGGFIVNGTVSGAGTGSGAVSIGLGGSGAGGGRAGAAELEMTGNTVTFGDLSQAITIQSVGGGGGAGGFSVSTTLSAASETGVGVGIGIGGFAGTGGAGADVRGAITGDTQTRGRSSGGITAQSLGGGGGTGGFSVVGVIGAGNTGAGSATIGIGGAGGAGGDSGEVNLEVDGQTTTAGDFSQGILAQSLGGGGGNGGFNASLGLAASGTGAGAAAIGIGGFAGGGGRSGSVNLRVRGDTGTLGASSTAIIVQSIGGGGGTGGFLVGGNVSGSGTGAAGVSVGVGGMGGSGGQADNAVADISGLVMTAGQSSLGALVQSVGGGGGSGGFTLSGDLAASSTGGGAATVGLGGAGGAGGRAADAELTYSGAVVTEGKFADGLVVQSLGGGGGAGGFAVTGALGAGATGAGAVGIGIGGFGGGGGNAGLAIARINGSVDTAGQMARGVLVQSVGGGGGAGGFAVGGTVSGAGTGNGTIGIGLGGFGGTGGSGGEVSFVMIGDTITAGQQAQAITAQSIGGGGGSGGFSVTSTMSASGNTAVGGGIGIGGFGGAGGLAGSVYANVTGNTIATGEDSGAIAAQSIGGGGGRGGFVIGGNLSAANTGSGGISIGTGGFGGGGGDSGLVDLTVAGTTLTTQRNSLAILAQSVGGGGGIGGFATGGDLSASGTGSGGAAVGLGGFGGSGGQAGNVLARVTGITQTSGQSNSAAILAQSVGGGGGMGGFSVAGNLAASGEGGGGATLGIGGFGGSGGDAGSVDLTVYGDTRTAGKDSIAVTAQSIGGGGGMGGFSVTGSVSGASRGSAAVAVGLGGFGGAGGDGGLVGLDLNGDVITVADRSSGVLAQSVGGGGGAGGFAIGTSLSVAQDGTGGAGTGIGSFGGGAGNGGRVEARISGGTVTDGVNSTGIVVQSVGGGGGMGGFGVGGNMSVSKDAAGSVGVGIGGYGGGGGQGGSVSLIAASRTGAQGLLVATSGVDSGGVVVQSVGGGGGTGGFAIGGALTVAKQLGGALSVGMGGLAGDGGDGDAVRADVSGLITTSGNRSFGVAAQSVGGGGGLGGFAISGAVSLSNSQSATIALGVGGAGGAGGDAGAVNLIRTGDTWLTGTKADGVLAQSIGGGGGMGGFDLSGALSVGLNGESAAFSLGMGGSGGAGGNSGPVSLTVAGNVIAGLSEDELLARMAGDPQFDRDPGGNAVVAQSVGGGGGIGGFNVAGAVTINKPADSRSVATAVGLGGFGGEGGDGGAVAVSATGADGGRGLFVANGDGNVALVAQSLGGGGGVGTVNISASVASDGSLALGVGGFGGGGGIGGDVTASGFGDFYAAGRNSAGFVAQSIGGGGGFGGVNIAGALTFGKEAFQPAVAIGLGGAGGSGNRAGSVTVDQTGSITVDGGAAIGLVAQSVGGGGGRGTFNLATAGAISNETLGGAYALGVGGLGGTGADGDAVRVVSAGLINVNNLLDVAEDDPRDNGIGILAQSIGGGGGAGGMNGNLVASKSGSIIQAGIGGTGGAGGNAGSVSVSRGNTAGTAAAPSDVIIVRGNNAAGLVAQSIGGGGGIAGMNFGVAGSKAGEDDADTFGAIVQVGGSGGAAGNAAQTVVYHNGTILTDGINSDALIAQSIGGGGGSANYSVTFAFLKGATASSTLTVGGGTGDGGVGGDVIVDQAGGLFTFGDNSAALRAQSIGGGGGSVATTITNTLMSANSLSLTMGRAGGTGGVGGNVAVSSSGTIATRGHGSIAIHAQSVGGGGGASSTNSVGVSVSQEGETEEDNTSQSFEIAMGLAGGLGARSGNVTVTNNAYVETLGNEARGILAQSIGGGGGTGGSTVSGASSQISMSLAMGGVGGIGGESGAVTVRNNGTVVTSGDDAEAIYAQSVGGGGGVGGANSRLEQPIGAQTSSNQASLRLLLGGVGGTGNSAGEVLVENTGQLLTVGERSHAIRAESIGGGGGSGGASATRRIQLPGNEQGLAVSVKVGGEGGEGGTGGAVTVTNSGQIVTSGEGATGILALSVGGGGGSGGSVTDIVIGGVSSASTMRMALNVGGSGSNGGLGGDVTVTNASEGSILTFGREAHGIVAMSIGGGGGRGGAASGAGVSALANTSSNWKIGLGGAEGGGNHAGQVTVTNAGRIETQGADAHGILAQSVGSGGGSASLLLSGLSGLGSNVFDLAVGAVRGGGDGGDVLVANTGTIITFGDGADGIRAQSIGGGGGNVLLSNGIIEDLKLVNERLGVALGSVEGPASGSAGAVSVEQTGTIAVYGRNAQAVNIQAVNGGGGSAAISLANITGGQGAAAQVTESRLGSSYSTGVAGFFASLMMKGDQFVSGVLGAGSVIQSIGGGGGASYINLGFVPDSNVAPVLRSNARILAAAEMPSPQHNVRIDLGGVGGSGNAGGDVDLTFTGMIGASGIGTIGQTLQSIGGGGGRSNVLLDVSQGVSPSGVQIGLGADAVSDSGGAAIGVSQTGLILTQGLIAPAVVLQSIGGGGGSAAVGLTGDEDLGAVADLSLGGSGGAGNNGGGIAGRYSGGLYTEGNGSTALLAQSIGGGGGDARITGLGAARVQLGGVAGAQGHGGDIDLSNNGEIVTTGVRAHAVLLQSIGGGGGAVFGEAASPTLRNGGSGTGGLIAFSQDGNIVADGSRSFGVIAQSLGGGGGWVDGQFAGTAGGAGRGGAISLSLAGDVVASNADSTAILAQSLGESGAETITIDVAGHLRGGSGSGMGVRLDGGTDNRVTINGTLSAVSRLAMTGGSGNDRLINNGHLFGNVLLGGGNNLLHNGSGASFMIGDTVQLRTTAGAGGTLRNDGVLLMGLSAPLTPINLLGGASFDNSDGGGPARSNLLYGARVVTQTNLTGDFVQSSSGRMIADVAFGRFAGDAIHAAGNATMSGTLDVTLIHLENARPYTIVSTQGGVGTVDGLNVPDTLALDYSVNGGPLGIQLSYVPRFDQPYLSPNGQALGRHLNSALLEGESSGIGQVMALLGNLRAGEEVRFAQLLDQINPEAWLIPMKLQYQAADTYRRQLLGRNVAVTEESKLWATMEFESFEQEGRPDQLAADSESLALTGGATLRLDDSWTLGTAIGYRRISRFVVRDNLNTQGTGDAMHLGAALTYEPLEDLKVSAGVVSGWQWMNLRSTRTIFEPLGTRVASKASFTQLAASVSYDWRWDHGFVRPSFDVAGTALKQGGYRDDGSGSLGLEALASTRWLWSFNPQLAAGFTLADNKSSKLQLQMRGGGVFQDGSSITMPYRLVGANPAADPALLSLGLNRSAAQFGGDLIMSWKDVLSLSASLSSVHGSRDNVINARLQLEMKF